MSRPKPICLAVSGLTLAMWLAAECSGQSLPSPPVRSTDGSVQQALAAGVERSTLFRRLVDDVAHHGGIVQIEAGRCGPRRACLLHWVAASGSVRFLRILVDPRLHEDERIALVGHELQHAVEVLSDPTIDTAPEIYWRFRGVAGSRAFETEAAVQVEARIRGELKRAAPRKCDTTSSSDGV